MTMGVYLDYPRGRPDTVEYAPRGANADTWTALPISGNYFPDGFIGPMAALQCFVEGSASSLPSHIEDAYQTMQLVEALYQSSQNGAAWVPLNS
jgi:predicted dehydrogenase